MPRRKVGFLGFLVGDGVEERMKTPTPTRTWGGWGDILFCFFLFFFVALGAWLFAYFGRWLLLLLLL